MAKQKNEKISNKTDEKIKVTSELLNSETDIASHINDIAADRAGTAFSKSVLTTTPLEKPIVKEENVGGTEEEGNGGEMVDEGGPITSPDALTLEQKQDIEASIGDGTHLTPLVEQIQTELVAENPDNKPIVMFSHQETLDDAIQQANLKLSQEILKKQLDTAFNESPPSISSSQQAAAGPIVVNLPDPDKLLRRDVVKAVANEPVKNNGGKISFGGTNSKGKANGRSANIHQARSDRPIKNV